MSDGELYITDINLSQNTELLYGLSGGNQTGRIEKRIELTIEGQGVVFEELISFVGTRPVNLYSMHEQRRFETRRPLRSIDLTLARVNKHSLALFDFNNIKADRIRNEVDEFRKIVRGCTARLGCINCKKLTILAKAMFINEEDSETKNDFFVGIHKA